MCSTRCCRSSRTVGLTDAQGRTVDFKNTVIIMTSNLGTRDLRKRSIGFSSDSDEVTYEKMRTKVNEELKKHFRPEFLNRIDEVIVYHELTLDEVKEIVDLMLVRVIDQLGSQGLDLVLSDAAKSFLAEVGLRPGAWCPAAASFDPAPPRGHPVREGAPG